MVSSGPVAMAGCCHRLMILIPRRLTSRRASWRLTSISTGGVFGWPPWKCGGVFRLARETGSGHDPGVANVTGICQAVAQEVGCRRTEIARMTSAFEHDDLSVALQLWRYQRRYRARKSCWDRQCSRFFKQSGCWFSGAFRRQPSPAGRDFRYR